MTNNTFNIPETLPSCILQQKIFSDGILLQAKVDDQNVVNYVGSLLNNKAHIIISDPPYGNILNNTSWDKTKLNDRQFSDWMVDWTLKWSDLLIANGAMYIWGGLGKPLFHPFFRYLCDIEEKSEGNILLKDLLTWKKSRAYGTSNAFLFCREELAFLIKGKDIKKPAIFNIPYLEQERGYAGFNKDYPAKSKFLRRSNVWADVKELFKNKLHICEKAARVCEIPIEVSSNPGDIVLDLFSGSGSTSAAARKLNRNWIAIELDSANFNIIAERMKE